MNGSRRLSLVLVIATAALCAPVVAHASTASITAPDTITYAAGAGEANALSVSYDAGSNTYVFSDPTILGITPGPGCVPNGLVMTSVRCGATNISNLAATLGDQADSVTFASVEGTDHATLSGGDGDDQLNGTDNNDVLHGDKGDDELRGGAGADTIQGGFGADVIDGQGGTDIADFIDHATDVTVTLDGTANDGSGGDVSGVTTDTAGSGDDNVVTEWIFSGGGDDTLIGNSAPIAATIAHGGIQSADNVFAGGLGADDMQGGGGTDRIDYSSRGAALYINLNGLADDGANCPPGGAIACEGDKDTSIEDVNGGTGNDVIIDSLGSASTFNGGQGNDDLRGGAGDDLLSGNDGNDDLTGGGGADDLNGGNGTDTADYSDHAGAVTVDIDGATDDGNLAEDEHAARRDNVATDVENLIGSGSGDTLTGNGVTNVIDGGAGNDTLNGGANPDTLNGGNDDDTLNGGAGNDTENGNDGADTFDQETAANGADTLSGGTGTDVFDYAGRTNAVTVSLDDQAGDGESGESDNVKTDVENGGGGAAGDTLTGSAGPNRLAGRGGNDSIAGAAGNDILIGGDPTPLDGDDPAPAGGGDDSLSGGAGDDTLYGGSGGDVFAGGADTNTASYADHQSAVTVTVDGQSDDGNQTEDGAADNVQTDVQNVTGSPAGDDITGSSSANTLDGAGGGDALDGGLGNDSLIGAAGDDSLAGSTGADLLNGGPGADDLSGGTGNDTLTYADHAQAVTVTLADDLANDGSTEDDNTTRRDNALSDIENLVGTAGADSLTGNDSANTLSGGTGADTFSGLGGNDHVFARDGVADTRIDCGTGTDTVEADQNVDDAAVAAGDGLCETVNEAAASDADADTIDDALDNCPNTSNADQADLDGDGQGDACDTDDDGDTVADGSDNCPQAANADQADTDTDGQGDACDGDDDNDGVADGADNCQTTGNADQADLDTDGQGDACDTDDDGDGVADGSDNCPRDANAGQIDTDGDGQGDACDSDDDGDGVGDGADACPTTAAATANGCPVTPPTDSDGDGVADSADACPTTAAATANGCPVTPPVTPPADMDGDGVADSSDACPTTAAATANGCPALVDKDTDADGIADSKDACPDVAAKTTDGCPRPLVRSSVPRQRLATALARGLRVSLVLNQPVSGKLRLTFAGRTVGSARVTETAPGVYTIKVRFTKAGKARLRKLRSAKLSLTGSIKGATTGVSSTIRRKVTLKK